MVTRQDVLDAYEWLLGRSPENEDVVASLFDLQSRDILRDKFLSSSEFREFFTQRYMSMFRIVFIRVPKTASSSVVTSMERMGLSVQMCNEVIPDLGPVFKSNDAIAGHFSYGQVVPALRGLRPIFLAVVRDPEKRAISLYRQATDQTDHPCHGEVVGKTLLEAIEKEGMFYQWIYNAQNWYVSQHHSFSESSSILDNDQFIISSMNNIDRLVRVVSKLCGAPLVSTVPENVSTLQSTRAISEQPGYEKALDVIRWITIEDRKLVAHVGGFFVSPGLRRLVSNRPGVFE